MKRIANPYGVLFGKVFKLKRGVRLYRKSSIFYEGDECCAIYYPPDITGKKNHRIIIADHYGDTLEKYLGCLAHEYIHAWQDENGYSFGHGEKSQFKPWARYLKRYYGIDV